MDSTIQPAAIPRPKHLAGVPDAAPRCPTCGTPRLPFDLRRSGLLDLALVAKEAISTLQRALEGEVLP
jgi:hypothetical protein